MIERLSPGWRNAILITLGLLTLWFCWTVRAVLNPLIAAYFLAYVVHPMVLKLERRGFARRAAVNIIFISALLFTVVISATVFFQGRGLLRDMTRGDGIFVKLEQGLDTFVAEHEDKCQWILDHIETEEDVPEEGAESAEGAGDSEETGEDPAPPERVDPPVDGEPEEELDFGLFVEDLFQRVLGELHGETATKAGKVGMQAAGGIAHFLAGLFGSFMALMTFLFLLPIYTWFLLFELGNIHAFISRYLPRRDRARFSRIGHQIGEVLANFFRGRLLVALLKGLYLTVFLWLIGVDYSLLIGLSSGFLSLIPFVGAMMGGVLAFAVANLSMPFGSALLWIVIIFVSAETIEGYVLIPKILGDSLGLPPLVVLFSVFLGGAALGVFGLLLALPLTACLLILVREFLLPALAKFADE